MPRKRSRLTWALVVFLIGATCILAAGSGLMAGVLPDLVNGLGAPAPWLQPHERVYLAGYLLLHSAELDEPLRPGTGSVELTIPEGATAAHVARQLIEIGFLDDPDLLINYLRYRGLDRAIEAGSFQLDGGLSLIELGSELQSAQGESGLFTVPEGWRREQIAQALASHAPGISVEEFLVASAGRPSSFSFSGELPAQGGLEGFLFPDSYSLDENTSGLDLVLDMLDNFEARVSPTMRQGFEHHGLSLYEAVTLASIVEREAVVADERPLIASVFLNRLTLGIKLDADPTVQYALGQQADGSWWKRELTALDLEIDSPYNTYRVAGLPPTPIANPGLASLQAVAEPAESVFLYFRAACDGSGRHRFAVTFEEHVGNACP